MELARNMDLTKLREHVLFTRQAGAGEVIARHRRQSVAFQEITLFARQRAEQKPFKALAVRKNQRT